MKSLRITLTLIGAALPGLAVAGSCNPCTIKNIGVGPYYDSICSSGSCAFIAMEGSIGSTCGANSYWHFALDTSTSSGKSTYALLLTAKTAGTRLAISGSGACSLSSAGLVENFYYVTFVD